MSKKDSFVKKSSCKKNHIFFFNKIIMNSETGIWQEVVNHPNYEICSEYPYEIRNKSTGIIVKENINNNTGYITVKLSGKLYLKHRLVAIQWIPNDDPALKDQVDHINRNRTDYHIENLRWVSRSENLLNRSMKNTTFIDELPEFTIAVDHYGKHENISGLYFCDDVFYVYTGVNYKTLTKRQESKNSYFIAVKLPDRPQLRIYYRKFKHDYGLN